MKKKVILNIQSVYTANAFFSGGKAYIGAGSETTSQVYLHELEKSESSLVDGCPGGVMSFVPVPGQTNLFSSIMGLFPPFVGLEAGVFRHRRSAQGWQTDRIMHLPFAHRCDILNRYGRNYIFAASCSKHKDNPQDWSRSGELYVIPLDGAGNPLEPQLIYNVIWRHHGMLKAVIKGKETILFSGAEGIFYLELVGDEWKVVKMFDHEVSEFGLIDFDGDGEDELVTIEPFHGNTVNIYDCVNGVYEKKYTGELSFGHGLSCGIFNGEPVAVVGNRRGSLTLEVIKAVDFAKGEFSREAIEQEAGPTQTQVFTAAGVDYILSANQLKNEVVLYTE